MDATEAHDLIRRMAMMLDGLQPLIDTAAMRERAAEAGKVLRCITMQERSRACFELVEEACAFLRLEDGADE